MWQAIVDGVFQVIAWFQTWVLDWGMAIIVVTIIFRLLMTPIIFKQSKSTYMMSKLQPEMNRIKERFPDDQVRQNEEMQKLYASTKFNPLAGCVPMLIQIPIFMALFQALRNISNYSDLGPFTFYGLVPDLTGSPSSAFAAHNGTFVPYIILLLIFAISTFVPMLIQQRNQTDPTQKRTTYIMAIVMTIMMLWIGWSSPAGVLLFWGASSVLGIAQMQISQRILKKRDKESAAVVVESAPVVNVVRKTKKKRPSKSR